MPSDQFGQLLAELRAGPSPVGLSVAAYRALDEEFIASLPPIPDDVQVATDTLAGLPVDRYTPAAGDVPRTLLYLHGGGYMSGSRRFYRDVAARLARACAARVVVPEYRLAPEHPFPAAVEDALAVYHALTTEWLAPGRIVVGGDSAGGGLAVALLVALRDGGMPAPAAGLLLSPWVDLTCASTSVMTNAATDPILSGELLRWMAHLYLQGQDPQTPLASPLFADLTGLPPLLVHVGSTETLLDDALRVAERARMAGVDVTLEVWDEMVHVWHQFAWRLPEGQQAIDRIGAWVQARAG